MQFSLTKTILMNSSDGMSVLRINQKGFIYHVNLGLYGFAFIDFGDKHKILDMDGERLKSSIVSLITNEEEGLITVNEEKRH